jgi:uncharacterized protein (TIGR02266 family)
MVARLTPLPATSYAPRVQDMAPETSRADMQATARDLRLTERTITRMRCWCEAENVTFYARVANISEGGIFLRTSTPLPNGSRTHLRFALAGPDNIEAQATVVWTREDGVDGGPPGMGMKFENVDDEMLGSLRRIISEQRGKT